jgi:starch synthase
MRIAVTQVCFGRLHHFDLARQLHASGVLAKIITGYPRWKLENEGLPKNIIVTWPWWQTPYMALARYGLRRGRIMRELLWRSYQGVDSCARRQLGDSNVLVAICGSGLQAGKEMQRRGGIYVCDDGSTHVAYHDRRLREEFERWKIAYESMDKRWLRKGLAEYEAANFITVPSEFVRKSFLEVGVPAAKIVKIPYGVDLTRFQKVGEPAKDTFRVLFVGQVGLRKGIPYLLQAFERLKHPAKELVIIGAMQPEMRYYRGSIPAGVRFLGSVPQAELKTWMSTAHVLVLPSIEEGLAMVQAQAMACGCPVIATESTGAEDLFTSGVEGLIVPSRDVDALTMAMQKLVDDETLRSTMAANSMSRVMKLGGWSEYGSAWVAVLEQVLGQKA